MYRSHVWKHIDFDRNFRRNYTPFPLSFSVIISSWLKRCVDVVNTWLPRTENPKTEPSQIQTSPAQTCSHGKVHVHLHDVARTSKHRRVELKHVYKDWHRPSCHFFFLASTNRCDVDAEDESIGKAYMNGWILSSWWRSNSSDGRSMFSIHRRRPDASTNRRLDEDPARQGVSSADRAQRHAYGSRLWLVADVEDWLMELLIFRRSWSHHQPCLLSRCCLQPLLVIQLHPAVQVQQDFTVELLSAGWQGSIILALISPWMILPPAQQYICIYL